MTGKVREDPVAYVLLYYTLYHIRYSSSSVVALTN